MYIASFGSQDDKNVINEQVKTGNYRKVTKFDRDITEGITFAGSMLDFDPTSILLTLDAIKHINPEWFKNNALFGIGEHMKDRDFVDYSANVYKSRHSIPNIERLDYYTDLSQFEWSNAFINHTFNVNLNAKEELSK